MLPEGLAMQTEPTDSAGELASEVDACCWLPRPRQLRLGGDP